MPHPNGRKPPNPILLPKSHGKKPPNPQNARKQHGKLPAHPYSANPRRYGKAIGKKPASKFPIKLLFFVLAVIVVGVLYLQAMQS